MSSNEYDLQKKAIQIICENLATCDYQTGDRIISSAIVIWMNKGMGLPHNEDDDHPFFSREANEQMLGDTLKKLSARYWAYFKKIEQGKTGRFNTPKTSLKSIKSMDEVKATRKKILKILETLDIKNGVEFIAILIVEWAGRFNAESFLQFVQQNNPAHREKLKNDSDIITEALYYMDTYFQLA